MEATQLLTNLHHFIQSNGLVMATTKANLRHDLIHAYCGLGPSLQEEMLVFCLQRGRLVSEPLACKYAGDICRMNRIVNDFNYTLLAESYSATILDLPDSLVDEVAILLNIV